MPSSESIDAAEQLLITLKSLRRAAAETEAVVRRGLKAADEGMVSSMAFTAVRPAPVRESLNDALKAVELARHRMRLAVFASALEDGVSIGELGRLFGFSRQLAARYAKEAHRPMVA